MFRNQSILVGETKDQVQKQARAYIERVLGLKNVALDDAVTIRQQEDRFTGALLYNYLAEQVGVAREDLEIMSASEFDKVRNKEDVVLK